MDAAELDRNAWRRQADEEAIEPGIAIIDAHHHLWPDPNAMLDDLFGAETALREFARSGHRIVGSVFMEGHARYREDGPAELRPVGETDYVEQAASAVVARGAIPDFCAGIVASADLALGAAVERVLDAHLAASRRVRGVRPLIVFDPDLPFALEGWRPHVTAEAGFREGCELLVAKGLSLDLWVTQRQLDDVAELADAMPELVVVLNHVGGPIPSPKLTPEENYQQWRLGMARVARCPNVMLKLGGLNMSWTGLAVPDDASRPWSSEQMAAVQRPYLLRAIELFGPERCMFESNFPVDRILTGASALWNSFKRIVADFSPAEKEALFLGTAKRVYRLEGVLPLQHAIDSTPPLILRSH